MDIEALAKEIVDSAYSVHKALGPGLLESAYQTCLAFELQSRGFKVDTEVILPVTYKNIQVEKGYRIDMLVENQIIIENKTVDEVLPVHKAQVLTYIKLFNSPIGFLINWKVNLIKNGIRRFVN